MASASEISVQLRESLKNGTLTLRDLDNKKRGSSRSKRRRGKKEDKGTASNVRDSGSAGQELLTQEGAQEMRKNCRRSSKYPKRSIELKNSDISDSQNSQDAEMIVCSLLDVIIDEAYRHCAAIEHSITKDHADALVVGLMSAFNETTIVKCKALQQQTRQIQELMLSAAEETLADLFIIAAHGGLPVPAKNCCDTTNFPPKKFEEAQYSLRKVAQQAMFDSGEEIVENTFSQDDSNYRLDSLEKHGIDSNELLVDENEEPPRGWRKYICCISPPKSQQKKEKTGFLSRLRHMFKCC